MNSASIPFRPSAPSRGGRRKWRLLAVLLALLASIGLLVGLAPQILARTALRHYLMDRATAALQLQVRCGSVSLSWLRPPELVDVRVTDSEQEALLELHRLQIDRPLWRLLQNPYDWGRLELHQPVVYLRCRAGGSNLEDLIQRAPRSTDSSVAWQGDIVVQDGTLNAFDASQNLCWTLTDWQAQVRLPAAGQKPVSFQTSLKAAGGPERSTISAAGRLTLATADRRPVAAEVQLQLQRFPAAVTQLLATRLGCDVTVDGVLDGTFQGHWQTTKSGEVSQLTGEVAAGALSAQSPAWRDDRVDLRHADLSLDVQSTANRLHVRKLKIASDLGELKIEGQFDRPSLGAPQDGMAARLPMQPCQITGNVDLAKLAQMAPTALHMRDDTRLIAGQIRWDLACDEADQQPCWRGVVEASQLQAEQHGRTVGIQQPVRLSFRLNQTAEGIRVDELVGQSTFLALRGQGQATEGQIAWRADLSRLHSDLGQLVDWRDTRLAGQCEGHLEWQSTTADDLQTQGHLTGRNLQVRYGTRVDLQEAELLLNFSARGRVERQRLSVLSTAELQLRSGGDQLSAQLTEPIANPFRSRRWPLQLHCEGQLDSWRRRLQGVIPADLPQVSGQLDAETQLLADPAVIRVSSARVTLQPLELLTADRRALWTEPIVRAVASGRYAPSQGQIELDSLEVKTGATELQATGTIQDLTGEVNVRFAGKVGYDLQRWSNRMQPVWGDQLQLAGRMSRSFSLEGPWRPNHETTTHPVSTGVPPSRSWFPEGLTAQLGFGWQNARAWGFDLEAGSLEAHLQRQRISVKPVSLPVSGGQLHLAPHIRLRGNPVLEMEPGLLIDKVQITPKICHGWLKYVAPLLANATQAEGRFSVELDDSRLPLNRPGASSVSGTLSVHSARVGPGPLSRQLLSLTGQIRSIVDPKRAGSNSLDPERTWVVLPEQRVPFRLEGGRVWHEDLTMLVGDLSVQTRGWVALNQRLSLSAVIPVQEKWLGDNRWLTGLKGQSLHFPIQGTLQQPQLNTRVLENLSRQTLTGAAEGLIQQELQQQLNRLLPKQ